MHSALHIGRWHAQHLVECAKKPMWRYAWHTVQTQCGGVDKFPSCNDFLGSSIDIYRYLQQELLSASNTRHLEDLVTADLLPFVQAASSEFEHVRKLHGEEECRIQWRSTDAFVCSLAPPESLTPPEEQGSENSVPVVIAGARFFSVMSMKFQPEHVRHTIDDLIFRSEWHPEEGVKHWKIAYIGGPVTPSE
eukprot:gnl/TRDRNA2_/TRDRNA2_198034_c0_seq1.p2 gnl/TRDRNA2_/TRDRNA2_198034_c0~~gnl/TRDRNA2_/TRDRNA2_198034_c0_seq1.p2  ORF type:complete len:192 (+),score=29.21 gnl/TRDRNA2_/TRDRNA2_198034_c0_seq1:83-658(+)